MKHVIAAGLLLLSSMSAQASTLDFNFSFTNTANTGGVVTGIVRGLTDNATSAATSVEVFTNTDGFGIGEYIGVPTNNSFTVVAGVITNVEFDVFGIVNSTTFDFLTPAEQLDFLGFFDITIAFLIDGNGPVRAGLAMREDSVTLGVLPINLTFTPAVAAVPLPAGAVLLLTGLGGLAVVRRRRAA